MRRGEKMRGQRPFKDSAARYESMAVALEAAARHSRAAVRHVRQRDVRCSSAHALAAYGLLLEATTPSNPQQGTTRRVHRSSEQVLRGGVAEAS